MRILIGTSNAMEQLPVATLKRTFSTVINESMTRATEGALESVTRVRTLEEVEMELRKGIYTHLVLSEVLEPSGGGTEFKRIGSGAIKRVLRDYGAVRLVVVMDKKSYCSKKVDELFEAGFYNIVFTSMPNKAVTQKNPFAVIRDVLLRGRNEEAAYHYYGLNPEVDREAIKREIFGNEYKASTPLKKESYAEVPTVNRVAEEAVKQSATPVPESSYPKNGYSFIEQAQPQEPSPKPIELVVEEPSFASSNDNENAESVMFDYNADTKPMGGGNALMISRPVMLEGRVATVLNHRQAVIEIPEGSRYSLKDLDPRMISLGIYGMLLPNR